MRRRGKALAASASANAGAGNSNNAGEINSSESNVIITSPLTSRRSKANTLRNTAAPSSVNFKHLVNRPTSVAQPLQPSELIIPHPSSSF
jgi:hypothetical protein